MLFLGATVLSNECQAASDLLKLDLEDLSQVPILESSATLTRTNPTLTPASTTVITHEDIIRSGARNLDELLDIYVPGLAYMYKIQGYQLGIRGIISDRNNKILLTLNGRNMNIKASDGGAASERWFSTLGDIRQITVISGPGSAVYGPGSIAGVINIETFDGNNFQGTETSFRAGAVESFAMGEFRHGHKLNDELGLFLYYGVDDYDGSDDAPHKLAFSLVNQPWPGGNQIPIEADKDIPFYTTSDNGAFQGKLRHKFHLQLDGQNFTLWTRFTRSGIAIPSAQQLYRTMDPEILHNTGAGNQQWTLYGSYTQQVNDRLSVDYALSHMVSDIGIENGAVFTFRSWREEDTTARILTRWSSDGDHDFALGTEYSYSHFGDPGRLVDDHSSFIGDKDYYIDADKVSRVGSLAPNTTWSAYMLSFFGEHQWHMNDQWTSFVGLRADKHRYTPWMFSPRLALVFQQDPSNSWKFSYNRSVRHADDSDLYSLRMKQDGKGDVEKIDNLEIIYTHYSGNGWKLDLSGYFNHHQVVSYNRNDLITEYIGVLDSYGLEAQWSYNADHFDLYLSHSFTQQLDFDLHDPELIYQNISASPYGHGNDLANWNTHLSKLRFDYRFSDQLTWTNSLRIYWGMPGAVDMADHNMAQPRPIHSQPLYDDSLRAFEESIFLDTGLEYRPDRRWLITVHGYNLLGLLDEDYNKRNYFQRTSHYRDSSPSLALRISYKFD